MFPFVVFAPCSFSVGEVRFLKTRPVVAYTLWFQPRSQLEYPKQLWIFKGNHKDRGITSKASNPALYLQREEHSQECIFPAILTVACYQRHLEIPQSPYTSCARGRSSWETQDVLTASTSLPSTQPTRLYTATSPFLGVRLLNSHSKLHPKDVVSSQISRQNTLHNSCLWTRRSLQPPARWEGDQTARLSGWTALGAKLFEAAGLNELSVYVIRGRFPPFLRFIQHRAPVEEQGVQTEILNEVLLQLKSLKDLRDHRNLKD